MSLRDEVEDAMREAVTRDWAIRPPTIEGDEPLKALERMMWSLAEMTAAVREGVLRLAEEIDALRDAGK